MKTMNNCLNCNKETKNPKFCSRSCSASITNIGNRKHGLSPANCILCNTKCNKNNSKYCSHKCHRIDQFHSKILEWKKTGHIDVRILRRYIIQKYNNICNCCGIKEWNGKPISMELEHIDGNGFNHLEENLILLCPNCHSQTLTYKGRNYGNGRTLRNRT